jgi:hypothetical protein
MHRQALPVCRRPVSLQRSNEFILKINASPFACSSAERLNNTDCSAQQRHMDTASADSAANVDSAVNVDSGLM